jgi:hypothetical protein
MAQHCQSVFERHHTRQLDAGGFEQGLDPGDRSRLDQLTLDRLLE